MRRRILSALAVMSLAVLGHFASVRLVGSAAPAFDLFLVAVLLLAIRGGQVEGMLAGVVAGSLADVIAGTPYGLHSFTLTAIGYAVGFAADRVAEMTAAAAGILAVAGGLLAVSTRIGLLYLFVTATPAFEWWWLPAQVGTSLVLVWAVRLATTLSGRLGGWQRGRQQGRLKL